MYPNTERRVLERFKIEGAKVAYKTAGGSTNIVNLIDISKGSVRFEMNSKIDNGDFLEIELDIPAKQKIIVKGHVVWTSEPDADVPGYAVMKFISDGTDEQNNSAESLNQVSAVLKAFHKDVKV